MIPKSIEHHDSSMWYTYFLVLNHVLIHSNAYMQSVRGRTIQLNGTNQHAPPIYPSDNLKESQGSARLLDLKSAATCYSEWNSYESCTTPPDWRLCYPSKTLSWSDYEPFTGTSVLETRHKVGPGSTYKHCDGFPRFRLDPKAIVSTLTSSISLVHRGWTLGSWASECTSTYTASPEPDCSVPKAYCDDLWKSYKQELSTFSETEPFQTAPNMPKGQCEGPMECVLNLQDDVVLLYWPAELASSSSCDSKSNNNHITSDSKQDGPPKIATITEIRLPGKDLYRKFWVIRNSSFPFTERTVNPTTLTGSWVVTSPYILLAHRAISSTTIIGQEEMSGTRTSPISATIRPAGVITLQPQDVYSRRPLMFEGGGLGLARSIANGIWRPGPGQLVAENGIPHTTEPFNFNNLQNPVPASVYYDAMSHCWGGQSYCATITDDSYHPNILIARHVWRSLLPDAYACGLPRLVDPAVSMRVFQDVTLLPADLPTNVPTNPTAESQPGLGSMINILQPSSAFPSPVPKTYTDYPKTTLPPTLDDFRNPTDPLPPSSNSVDAIVNNPVIQVLGEGSNKHRSQSPQIPQDQSIPGFSYSKDTRQDDRITQTTRAEVLTVSSSTVIWTANSDAGGINSLSSRLLSRVTTSGLSGDIHLTTSQGESGISSSRSSKGGCIKNRLHAWYTASVLLHCFWLMAMNIVWI